MSPLRACRSCRLVLLVGLLLLRLLLRNCWELYGTKNWELGTGNWELGTGNWVLVKLGAIATCVQALVSARGSVERSAPPVRVHNLYKTWLRRLPGAAARAAPGPLDRLQGQGVSQGGFQVQGTRIERSAGRMRSARRSSDEIRTCRCWIKLIDSLCNYKDGTQSSQRAAEISSARKCHT